MVLRLTAPVQAEHILGSISRNAGIRLREGILGLPSIRETSINEQWMSLMWLQGRSTWHTRRAGGKSVGSAWQKEEETEG